MHVKDDWLLGAWAAYDVNNNGMLSGCEVARLLSTLRQKFQALEQQRSFDGLRECFRLDIDRDFFAGMWCGDRCIPPALSVTLQNLLITPMLMVM